MPIRVAMVIPNTTAVPMTPREAPEPLASIRRMERRARLCRLKPFTEALAS